ncbi:pectate lyase family protein [Bacillus sp. UNC41MFS5]|uniref:pectate lyase family protein n=1 Tax=Bacillus sp. UNC41MFS5 TaxID=1449046 RepID=UPI0012DD4C42
MGQIKEISEDLISGGVNRLLFRKLRVTLHHNYFDGVEERQLRVRFGQVHT